MITELREILQEVSVAYIFVGDGEPFFVINPPSVERRKRLYESMGIAVEVIPVTAADLGEDENLDRILKSGGEKVEPKEEAPAPKATRTRKKIKQ